MVEPKPLFSPPAPLTLGLSAFEKISAIEGGYLTEASKRMFADFDARELTAAQRRREIADKHRKKRHPAGPAVKAR